MHACMHACRHASDSIREVLVSDADQSAQCCFPGLLDWFMGAPIDIIAGFLIFASTMANFMSLQWKGYKAGQPGKSVNR